MTPDVARFRSVPDRPNSWPRSGAWRLVAVTVGDVTTTTELPELLTTNDLRALLRVGRTAVYDITRRADFPPHLTIGGTYRWRASQVRDWIDAQESSERPARQLLDDALADDEEGLSRHRG